MTRLMAYRSYHIEAIVVFILFLNSVNIEAQISPGKLTSAHTRLEGISNCTACHDLGNKISQQKCLDCHKPLDNRIKQNKGYHVSTDVKGKTCISCHSEHHGTTFEMVRFDEKKFNHRLTGYDLLGGHKNIDCAKCHQPANISDIKIKLTQGTFLGLDPKCISCHDDYHQKTLSSDCAQCHDFNTFVPASKFNHNTTDFALTGGHAQVDCVKCHNKETKNGKDFQQFANVQFKNCSSCHSDPHHGEFGTDCKSCHSIESFQKMKTTSAFNHKVTGFELEGKHTSISCNACHDNRAGTKGNYKEFENIDKIVCLTCHKDVHENKFGNDCAKCHSQSSFRYSTIKGQFDHNLTDFTLEGKHQNIDCKKCHTGTSMIEPLAFGQCASCHQDYHKGQFEHMAKNDCNECHSTIGFDETSYGFERHNLTKFPLKGGHMATPCLACHQKGEEWTFSNLGSACIDCHDNIHEGYIQSKYMSDNNCASCHDNERWSSISFDHSATSFALEGRHIETACRSCHFQQADAKSLIIQKFEGLDVTCASCHDNTHGDQFVVEGVTDCKRCHGFNAWDSSNFNHDNTAFKLEGAHIKVKCEECHKPEIINGNNTVLYKTGKLACIDCHL